MARRPNHSRLLLALGAAVLLGLAAPAAADPDPDTPDTGDRAFFASLQAVGISYNRPDQAVITAKTVCRMIAEGKSGPDVLAALQQRNPGLTPDHGTQFMAISVRSYCPRQLVPTNVEAPAQP